MVCFLEERFNGSGEGCLHNEPSKSFTDHVLVITTRKDMLVHYLLYYVCTELLAQDNTSQL